MSNKRKLEAGREKPVAAKSWVSIGTNGEAILTLDAEMQKRIALKVQRVASGTIVPEATRCTLRAIRFCISASSVSIASPFVPILTHDLAATGFSRPASSFRLLLI